MYSSGGEVAEIALVSPYRASSSEALPARWDRSFAPAPSGGDYSRNYFEIYSRKWLAATEYTSSSRQMRRSEGFSELLAMGNRLVPLVLERLDREPYPQWFILLRDVSGADPVSPQHKGLVHLMAEDWLAWGRQHNFG